MMCGPCYLNERFDNLPARLLLGKSYEEPLPQHINILLRIAEWPFSSVARPCLLEAGPRDLSDLSPAKGNAQRVGDRFYVLSHHRLSLLLHDFDYGGWRIAAR